MQLVTRAPDSVRTVIIPCYYYSLLCPPLGNARFKLNGHAQADRPAFVGLESL